MAERWTPERRAEHSARMREIRADRPGQSWYLQREADGDKYEGQCG